MIDFFEQFHFIQQSLRIKTRTIKFVRFIWYSIYSFKFFVSLCNSTNLFVILFTTEKSEKYLLRKINVLNIWFKFQIYQNAGTEKTIGVFWFHFFGFGKKASQWIGSSHGEKQGFGWVGKLWKPVSIGIFSKNFNFKN